MAHKWIISIDNEFRMANVDLHRDMTTEDEKKHCLGGGYFVAKGKDLILYSSSVDFGQVSEEEFKEMYIRPTLKRRFDKIFFTQIESIGAALMKYDERDLPFIDL